MNILDETAGTYRVRIDGLSMRQIKDIFEEKWGALMWSGGSAYPAGGVSLQFITDRAALASQPGSVGEWRRVPVEPTPAMLVAMWDHREAMRGQSENHIARAGYAAMLAAALSDAPQAEGWVMVPVDVLKAASESLGSFVSDHGWGDADMQAMDNLDAYLAATPRTAVEPEGCTHGNTYLVEDCLRCGAPICCGKCCAEDAQAASAPTAVEPDERAMFEAWCEAHLMPAESDWFRREPDEPDEYRNPMIDMAWEAWQARASKGTPL